MAKKATPRKAAPKKKKVQKKKKNAKGSSLKRILKFSLMGVALLVVAAFLLFGSVYIGLFGSLPSKEDLLGIKQDNASVVYSKDGILLGKYFVQNRSQVAFGEIPKIVIDALVATEDNRFFYHEGIDFYSIPRVVIKTMILGDKSGGGGSTISQQLVKNTYGRENFGSLSMPVNKLKENITALQVEELYSKEEIITLYFNTVSFGENVFGLKAASQRYFSKLPQDLRVEEAATLVGMLKANTSYNPRLHPEASKERRNTVLALMVQGGFLDVEDFEKIKGQEIKLKYHNVVGSQGIAPYLRDQLVPELKEILSNTRRADGKSYNLYTDGLRIELTIDGQLQRLAEKAVEDHMSKLQTQFETHWKGRNPWENHPDFLWNEAKKSRRYERLKNQGKSESEINTVFNTKTQVSCFTHDGYKVKEMSPLDSIAYHQMFLQAGFIAMDAHSGEILAYVGGVDHSQFPYDHVYAKRQVGSVFKPFVYTAALESGMSPCDYIENEPIIFSNYDNWSPQNADGKYGGYYSMKGGLTKSVNTIAARLIAETGPKEVINVAERFGVEGKIPEVPSIALGVANLSLRDMVPAYAPFVNGGKTVKPVFIHRILTSNGTVLYESSPSDVKQVVETNIAMQLREMLESVADSGTARSLRYRYGLRSPLGGKTGTTQNNADGWFVGFSPNIVFGAWVGGESSTVRFRSTALGQGAATALPIVGNWLHAIEKKAALKKKLGTRFPQPDANQLALLDCPIFVDEIPNSGLFDDLFQKDEAKREKRKKEKEKKKAESDSDGWMKKLLKKFKKK